MTALFTPDTTALLLIDHQVGTTGFVRTGDPDTIRRFAVALAEAAAILDVPVVMTSSEEEDRQGPMLPELEPVQPEAFANRIRRRGTVNAWDDPRFRDAVVATGRSCLAMAGVTTDVCLVYPAVAAAAEGFAVQAVLDASGSPFETSELAARARMQQAGVALTATNTLLAELAGDWSSEAGARIVQLLYGKVMTG